MTPVDFEGSNAIFVKPEGWTDEECKSIPALIYHHQKEISDGVHIKQDFVITAWSPTEKDFIAWKEGRPLFLQIYGGGMPPVALYTLDENGNPNL